MSDDPQERGLDRRQTLIFLSIVAVWLLLVYTVPPRWSLLVGLAGFAAYSVWAMLQKHPPHPRNTFGGRRQYQIEIEVDKALKGLELPPPGDRTLLRPAEPLKDGDTLLRPAANVEPTDPDMLLRAAEDGSDGRPV